MVMRWSQAHNHPISITAEANNLAAGLVGPTAAHSLGAPLVSGAMNQIGARELLARSFANSLPRLPAATVFGRELPAASSVLGGLGRMAGGQIGMGFGMELADQLTPNAWRNNWFMQNILGVDPVRATTPTSAGQNILNAAHATDPGRRPMTGSMLNALTSVFRGLGGGEGMGGPIGDFRPIPSLGQWAQNANNPVANMFLGGLEHALQVQNIGQRPIQTGRWFFSDPEHTAVPTLRALLPGGDQIVDAMEAYEQQHPQSPTNIMWRNLVGPMGVPSQSRVASAVSNTTPEEAQSLLNEVNAGRIHPAIEQHIGTAQFTQLLQNRINQSLPLNQQYAQLTVEQARARLQELQQWAASGWPGVAQRYQPHIEALQQRIAQSGPAQTPLQISVNNMPVEQAQQLLQQIQNNQVPAWMGQIGEAGLSQMIPLLQARVAQASPQQQAPPTIAQMTPQQAQAVINDFNIGRAPWIPFATYQELWHRAQQPH
jgi:hypothetical protein